MMKNLLKIIWNKDFLVKLALLLLVIYLSILIVRPVVKMFGPKSYAERFEKKYGRWH